MYVYSIEQEARIYYWPRTSFFWSCISSLTPEEWIELPYSIFVSSTKRDNEKASDQKKGTNTYPVGNIFRKKA